MEEKEEAINVRNKLRLAGNSKFSRERKWVKGRGKINKTINRFASRGEMG